MWGTMPGLQVSPHNFFSKNCYQQAEIQNLSNSWTLGRFTPQSLRGLDRHNQLTSCSSATAMGRSCCSSPRTWPWTRTHSPCSTTRASLPTWCRRAACQGVGDLRLRTWSEIFLEPGEHRKSIKSGHKNLKNKSKIISWPFRKSVNIGSPKNGANYT